ncbi:MAG: peptidase U32 family protein [Lentisphaeria bacterium]
MMMQRFILLSPAGDFTALAAALDNGADAIYFGVGKLNMRSLGSANFCLRDLPEIVRRCHVRGASAWLALNTVIYEAELAEVEALCQAAKAAGVAAVIAGDLAVLQIARACGLSVHLSVQANICNSRAMQFYAGFVDVVVLARELTLSQIRKLCEQIQNDNIRGPSGNLLNVEIFIHGALCMAVAGSCYLSLAEYNSSANRGACFQNCRRSYTLRDTETDAEILLDQQYLLSPKDLCTLPVLDKILSSGVCILKIEGRGRSADYVAAVTSVYREAINEFCSLGHIDREKIPAWQQRLKSVYNRGFWEGGYYLGDKISAWAKTGENQAQYRKSFLGPIVNYYGKAQAAEATLQAGQLLPGEKVLIIGPTSGAIEVTVPEIRRDGQAISQACKGDTITFHCPDKVRPNDQLYRLQAKRKNLHPPEKSDPGHGAGR